MQSGSGIILPLFCMQDFQLFCMQAFLLPSDRTLRRDRRSDGTIVHAHVGISRSAARPGALQANPAVTTVPVARPGE